MSKMNRKFWQGVTAVAVSLAMALSLSGTVMAATSAAKDGNNVVLKEEGDSSHTGTENPTAKDLSPDSSSVLVRSNIATTYNISIPKSIELTHASSTKIAKDEATNKEINVAYNLAPGQILTITTGDANGKLNVKHLEGVGTKSQTISTTLGGTASWTKQYFGKTTQFEPGTTLALTLKPDQDIYAGHWLGYMDFKVSVTADDAYTQ